MTGECERFGANVGIADMVKQRTGGKLRGLLQTRPQIDPLRREPVAGNMVNNVYRSGQIVIEPPAVGGHFNGCLTIIWQSEQDIQRNRFLDGNFLSRRNNARKRSGRKASLFIHHFQVSLGGLIDWD